VWIIGPDLGETLQPKPMHIKTREEALTIVALPR
jgi:hypothetical protein